MWILEFVQETVFNINEEYILPVLDKLEINSNYVEIEIKDVKNYIEGLFGFLMNLVGIGCEYKQALVLSYKNFKNKNESQILVYKNKHHFEIQLINKMRKNIFAYLIELFKKLFNNMIQ